jgi:hypothetical protein
MVFRADSHSFLKNQRSQKVKVSTFQKVNAFILNGLTLKQVKYLLNSFNNQHDSVGDQCCRLVLETGQPRLSNLLTNRPT